MRVPNFKDVELTKYLNEWNREFENMKKEQLSSITGNKSVLLYSPSLKVFEVTVTDAGALVVTKVSGT